MYAYKVLKILCRIGKNRSFLYADYHERRKQHTIEKQQWIQYNKIQDVLLNVKVKSPNHIQWRMSRRNFESEPKATKKTATAAKAAKEKKD